MKVISWNILHGQPLPPPEPWLDEATSRAILHEAAGRLLSSIGGQDFILGIQEVDANQERSAQLHQVKVLAEALGAEHWAFAPAIFGTPGSTWRKVKREDRSLFTSLEGEGLDSDLANVKRSSSSKVDIAPQIDDVGPMYGIGLISSIPVKRWHRIELGKSPIGLKMRFPEGDEYKSLYIEDENRVALVAELENGFTILVTHLSFVPLANLVQYWWLLLRIARLPGKKLIMGDLNLPWNIPQRVSLRRSLAKKLTWPIWDPKFQLDYLLVPRWQRWARKLQIKQFELPELGLSDHHPLGVEIQS